MANPYNVDIRGGTATYNKNSDPYNAWGAQNRTTYKPADQPAPKKSQDDALKAKKQAQEQQAKAANNSLFSKAKRVVSGVVEGAADTTGKAVNTVAAGTAGAVGLATAGVQRVKGDKAGAKRTINATQEEINQQLEGNGVAGKGSYLTTKQAQQGGKALIKPAAQAVTDIIPYVAPVGVAGKGISLGTKVVRGAVDNAALSGGTTVANEALNGRIKDKATAKETLQSVAIGAIVGGLFPVAHAVVARPATQEAKLFLQRQTQAHLLDNVRPPEKPAVVAPEVTPEPAPNTLPQPILDAHNARTTTPAVETPATPTAVSPKSVEAAPAPVPKVASETPEKVSSPDSTTQPAEFAQHYMANNKEQAMTDYAARTKAEFGNTKNNVVSGDEAKFVIPGFGPDKSIPYHEAASAFAKEHYANLLKDKTTQDQPVLITAGGSGAGKTVSLQRAAGDAGHPLDKYAAVVDTNLTDMKGANSRIDAARKSGRDVIISYVYRHHEDAYANGVIPRAQRTGRVVTPAIHANTHAGSIETIQALADKYKDDPHVKIRVTDNSRGKGEHVPVSLDFLKDKGYTKEQIELKIHQLLDEHLSSNKITTKEFHELKGHTTEENPRPTSGRSSADANRKPQEEHSQAQEVAKPATTTNPDKSAIPEERMTPVGDVITEKRAKLATDTKEPSKGPVEASSDTKTTPKVEEVPNSKFKSRVYERLQQEQPEALKDDVGYKAINLKEDAAKAADIVATDKNKAYRIAMGIEDDPSVTSTAVNIAMSEKALEDGNVSLYSQLVKSRSLTQTRRGQEIVAEKGSVTDNSTSRYVKELLQSRLGKLGKGYLNDIHLGNRTKNNTPTQRAVAVVDKQVTTAQKTVRRSSNMKIQQAQDLIDSLAC